MRNFNIKNQTLMIRILRSWEGFSIEELFRDYWKAPKKLVHEWRMSKEVKLNGEVIPWKEKLAAGDSLTVPVVLETEKDEVTPVDFGIEILYEDDVLLVANKPSGLDTHPAEKNATRSLLNGVAFHLKQTGQPCTVRHIHRLDKDTTGAVLFAKDRLTGSMLDRMLEERKITRTYIALVEGILHDDAGKIEARIGGDRHHATRRRVSPSGQTAITNYQVLKRYSDENRTLVSCTLESGRTHQIRVHFSHIGHPLAGDTLYGGKKSFPRQALHARKIEFLHPLSEEKLTVEAPFLDRPSIFTGWQ